MMPQIAPPPIWLRALCLELRELLQETPSREEAPGGQKAQV